MKSKVIMTSSAVVMGAVGILLSFMPDTVLGYLTLDVDVISQLLVQMLGALYFGFAMLNWMTKASLIGGIYNRPIAMANFTHFMIAGLALVKGISAHPEMPYAIWTVGMVYGLFGISFGVILFTHPIKES